MKGNAKANRMNSIEKQLRAKSRASAAALAVSVLMLVGIFLFSAGVISRLEAKLLPLIDEAMLAARSEDFASLESLGQAIDGILREHESELMICTGHRDIIDLLRCSSELASLGAGGERDDYIEALSSIRVLLHLLRENNTVSLGNVL